MNGRLEESTGLVFRFVIGRTSDRSKMSALHKEVAEYDDFLLLDLEEEYSKLPYKTLVDLLKINPKNLCFMICSDTCLFYSLAFFKAAHALYESDFYVKADDDIYLRPG